MCAPHKRTVLMGNLEGGVDMEYSKDMLFFCYDFLLQKRLKARNIKFITTAISNDQKRFWLYFRTDEVNTVIKQHIKQ